MRMRRLGFGFVSLELLLYDGPDFTQRRRLGRLTGSMGFVNGGLLGRRFTHLAVRAHLNNGGLLGGRFTCLAGRFSAFGQLRRYHVVDTFSRWGARSCHWKTCLFIIKCKDCIFRRSVTRTCVSA